MAVERRERSKQATAKSLSPRLRSLRLPSLRSELAAQGRRGRLAVGFSPIYKPTANSTYPLAVATGLSGPNGTGKNLQGATSPGLFMKREEVSQRTMMRFAPKERQNLAHL